jgi:hypothetical protein
MCIVCTEWQLGKLTTEEAKRNLRELINAGSIDSETELHIHFLLTDDTWEQFHEES